MRPRMLHILYTDSDLRVSSYVPVPGLLQGKLLSVLLLFEPLLFEPLLFEPLLFDLLPLGSLLTPLIGGFDILPIDSNHADHGVHNHLFGKVVVLLQAPLQCGMPVVAAQPGEQSNHDAGSRLFP